MSVVPPSDDFTPPASDEGSDTAHVDADPGPTPETVQIKADDPDFDETARKDTSPVGTPDQPVMRERAPADEPPLRAPDEDRPEEVHLPEDEEEKEGE